MKTANGPTNDWTAKDAPHWVAHIYRDHFTDASDFTFILSSAYLAAHDKQPCAGNAQDLNPVYTAERDSTRSAKSMPDWDWEAYCRYRSGRSGPDQNNGAPQTYEFQEVFELVPDKGVSDESTAKPNRVTQQKDVRITVASAYQGQGWSVTVRDANGIYRRAGGMPIKPRRVVSPWRSSTDCFDATATSPFLFSIRDTVAVLYDLIFARGDQQGLVLITGSTNASKSKITRGLIYHYLMLRAKQRRSPHLVTHEDPIEAYFVNPNERLSETAHLKAWAVDYTPRQVGFDTKDLTETLRAAKRQTPAALLVGEIRDPAKELPSALDFGGTGHLIFATAHAGSLIESVGKIFDAVQARRPGDRAVHAAKILAVVHLKAFGDLINPEHPDRKLSAVVPRLYRRTHHGLQSLVSDGLSSLLPYVQEFRDKQPIGSLGRQCLVERILERCQRLDRTSKVDATQVASAEVSLLRSTGRRHPWHQLLKHAFESDLHEG